MKHRAALLPLALVPGLGGCLGHCTIFDGCPSFTDDRARDDIRWPKKVVPIEPYGLAAALKHGDEVRYEDAEGHRYKVRVEAVDAEAFSAWGTDSKLYKIRYAKVARLGIVREKTGGDYVGDFFYNVLANPPAPF